MKTVLCATVCPLVGPYLFHFPSTLTGDESITIKGRVTDDDQPRIIVNILEDPTEEDKILLHFNPRFDTNTLVRNSKIDGEWGERLDDGEMPFVRGENFELNIVVRTTHYELFVNGSKHSDFDHRLPIGKANYILFQGCLEVNKIVFNAKSDVDESIENLEMPLSTPISLYSGKKIYISGIAPEGADTYSINLCAAPTRQDGDIQFHTDIRFDHESDRNAVVFNAKGDGNWQDEERPVVFPLEVGKFHNITIEVAAECYKFAVNDEHFYDFNHRLPVEGVKHLIIDGDFELRSVQIL